MSTIVATVIIIALSAFFVAVEFAMLAARRYRLEDAATTSRSARAALRSSSELTVLLAGSQLGITACTLALGAVTKPAVHHALTPVLEGWGLPLWVADVAAFVLALVIVTFLHLVVGEMAPKSWAIAHPEASATMLALPMRAFMWVVRPLLRWLNEMANWCLRKVGVTPVDEAATSHNADGLRHLVEHSANVGALDASYSAQLSGALDLQRITVADLLPAHRQVTAVPATATVADLQETSRNTGHLRILVRHPAGLLRRPADGEDRLAGVVHVRDTLALAPETPVSTLLRPVFELDRETPLSSALAAMRETRNHLAVVRGEDRSDRSIAGIVTLYDVVARLFPRTLTGRPGQRTGPGHRPPRPAPGTAAG